MTERLLSTSEVASMAGVQRATVFREIKRGNLPAELVAGRYVITGENAERWLRIFTRYARKSGPGTGED